VDAVERNLIEHLLIEVDGVSFEDYAVERDANIQS
jgi:hypothetical protein